MPICIECRYPVQRLYDEYSKADDRSLGKGVRLTQCPRCKRFADKYVEHDFVVLFIDLVLIKPQVYRHLLFNRLGREDDRFDVCSVHAQARKEQNRTEYLTRAPARHLQPSIIRLGVLLLLFDVYLTWARVEKATPPLPTLTPSSSLSRSPSIHPLTSSTSTTTTTPSPSPTLNITTLPLITQYLFFLTLNTLSTLLHHLTIRLLATHVLPHLPFTRFPRPRAPNSISTALLVSSCTKLFPILMVIWDYDVPAAARSVGWAVVVNNVEALNILLDCGYGVAGLLAGAGAAVRWVVARRVLGWVGLDGEGGSVVGDLRALVVGGREVLGRVGLG